MKNIYLLFLLLCVGGAVIGQGDKITVIFGEYFSKDTVVVLLNKEQLLKGIIGDSTYKNRSAEVSFVRSKKKRERARETLWIFVNTFKLSVRLNDYKKFRFLIVEYLPNSSDQNDRILLLSTRK